MTAPNMDEAKGLPLAALESEQAVIGAALYDPVPNRCGPLFGTENGA